MKSFVKAEDNIHDAEDARMKCILTMEKANIYYNTFNIDEASTNYKYALRYSKEAKDKTISASIDFLGNEILTANVNIHLFKNDDPAGDAFVYYDKGNLTEYNTGSVKFDVEIK